MTTPGYTDIASSATIGTTERSLVGDTTSGVPLSNTTKIKDATLVLDCNALVAGDEFLLQIYEKTSAGTQRVMRSIPLVGAQPVAGVVEIQHLWLGDGYDITLKKTAGTDRAIRWSIREDLGDANVTHWLGTAPVTPGTAGVPSVDPILWKTGTIPTPNVTGVPIVDDKYLLGTIYPTPTVAGVPNVNVKTWNDLTTVALPLVPTTAGRTFDVSATGEGGLDFDNIKQATGATTLTNIRVPNVTLVDTLTTYTGNTPQTGDNFARLGAPAGASVSADVAAVKAQTAAIDAKTTNLPSDPADESLIITATDAVMARLGAPAGASIAADIATRAAAATALSTAQWTNPRAALLDHLDADVSSVSGGGGGGPVLEIAPIRYVEPFSILVFDFFVRKMLIDTAETDPNIGKTGLVEANLTVNVCLGNATSFSTIADGVHTIIELGDGWYRFTANADADYTDADGEALVFVEYDPGVVPDGYQVAFVWAERYVVGAVPADDQDPYSHFDIIDQLTDIIDADVIGIPGLVWDELKSAHTIPDSFGDYLDDEITSRASQEQVSNIAVTSAALNAIAASRTITTGTETGTIANATQDDGTFWSIADVAGTTDVYAEFDVSATTGAVAVGAMWKGYLSGVVNTIKVYARNWGGASWDQIGTIVGIAGTVESTEEFELTSAHTSAGLARIRFSNTGLTASSLKTDRLLLGYVVVAPTVAAIQSGLATAAALATAQTDLTTIKGYLDTEIAAILAAVDTEIATLVTGVADIQNRLPTALTVGGNMKSDALKWNGLTTVELPLVPTTAGRKALLTAAGAIAIDWANVENPATTLNLSGTTTKNVTDIATTLAMLDVEIDALPAATVAALGDHNHDPEDPAVNLSGLWVRQEAAISGKREVTVDGSNRRVKYKDRGDNTVIDGVYDPVTGARAESTVDGDV